MEGAPGTENVVKKQLFTSDHALICNGKTMPLHGSALLYNVTSIIFDGRLVYFICKIKLKLLVDPQTTKRFSRNIGIKG